MELLHSRDVIRVTSATGRVGAKARGIRPRLRPQAIRAIGHEVHGFLEPWGDLDGDAVSDQLLGGLFGPVGLLVIDAGQDQGVRVHDGPVGGLQARVGDVGLGAGQEGRHSKVQWERQQMWTERLGPLWSDHGLVFARDGYKIRPDGIKPGGPQDAGQVSARWRSTGQRLGLPDRFRTHDWRHSKATNDLEAGENPVEVSANVRHHSPGYTMAQYGKRRVEGARKPASGTAERIGLEKLA
ncbi:MAG TPA: hypothetical protein VFH94_25215 [Streptomyces sp.]|nr:hypothetical protein [Streptomyces sp.]